MIAQECQQKPLPHHIHKQTLQHIHSNPVCMITGLMEWTTMGILVVDHVTVPEDLIM